MTNVGNKARLVWGVTTLARPRGEKTGLGYRIDAEGPGTGFGNPEAVITSIRSHLQDGSLASITSRDNRQGTARLRVTSATHAGLAAAEKALAAEQSVPGFSTLTWTPNELLAYPTVFDVVYAEVKWESDDFSEAQLRRYFLVEFELLPFGRDAARTVVQATGGPATPTSVVVDDGSSATGWSSPGATLAADDGKIRVTTGTSTPEVDVIRTGAVSLPVETRIVSVDSAYVYGGEISLNLFLKATSASALVATTLVAAIALANGYTRYSFQVPASFPASAAALVSRYGNLGGYGDTAVLRIDQVVRTNTVAGSGTNRQQSRTLTVGGSARARASLVIRAPSVGQDLGDLTILYTRTAGTGLQPPLTPYRVAGPTVTSGDAVANATISNGYASLGTSSSPTVYLVPANKLREAAHLLLGRLRATSANSYTITWSAALTTAGGQGLAETVQSITGTTTVGFAAANTWQTNELGLLQLPTVPVARDSTHTIRISVYASSAAVQVDLAWLFDLDNGALTVANTAGLTRLEVRTADLENPERTVWGGAASGGTAAEMLRADWRTVPVVTASNQTAGSLGDHQVTPGAVDIFTVTSGTDTSVASALYYRSWLHNAGPQEEAAA